MLADHLASIDAAFGDRYKIERELGRGGLATVYLADDLTHHRKVAIKVVHPELATAVGGDRFLRELEIATRLQHPHILPLYESGVADDLLYYVMPFVQGESLRQKLMREGRLPVDEAVAITVEVAAALSFAHAEGIVHRDIKPENILIHDGEAMVADFGSGLALERANNGRLAAMPEYMSPEQAVGEPRVDSRSDVYSLACVLYEMLAGELPHTGPTPQVLIANRLTTPAPGVRLLRGDVPIHVERALAKALAPDPADRFATAASIADALFASKPSAPAAPTVAVLPFVNLSADPDNEFFADGVTEDVIAQLARIRALRVISRTSVMQFKKRDQSLRQIGAALGATTILEGSVRRAGNRVRIVGQLIDVESDQHLWTETYDRQLTDIFAIQSDVAVQIAAALRAELTRDERTRIGKEPTANLDAHQLYLKGRHRYIRYNAAGVRESIESFERAIAADASYAMPYVGLALAYSELAETGAMPAGEARRQSKDAAVRALALDPELGEAHCAVAVAKFMGDYDWIGAEQSFKRSLELTPGSADTYDLYGRLCSSLCRFDEAITMQTRAYELDPLAHRNDLATSFLRAGLYEEARRAASRAIDGDPQSSRGYATLAWTYAKRGQYPQGLEHLQTAVALTPDATLWLAQLGQVHAMAGQREEARAVLRRLEESSTERYVSPYHFAYVYTGLDEHDRAIDYLERAYEDRAGAVHGIKGSFLFTPLHDHPRFTALLRKMNIV
jgi:TolB-like protein/tetratricopeptide (TPR) repeat protein/tRNA A-37 threonylcarbamoyl transferase component Bud32